MDNHTTSCQTYQSEQLLIGGRIITNNGNSPYHISLNGDKEQQHGHAHKPRKQPIAANCYRKVIAFGMIPALTIIAVYVGVVYLQATPTRHGFNFGSEVVRKSRTLFSSPDLTRLSRNHSSFLRLAKLHSSGLRNCSNSPDNCQGIIPCNNTKDQPDSCRCPHGHYLKDRECLACTVCSSTQYPATPCSSHEDRICIDVSFPVGILPMNKTLLLDDGRVVSVTHSPNVFVERLINLEALETPMYVTNNQQSLDFVWPRPSGLDIAVSVSDVYLVPDYEDVEAVDDTALFHRLVEPSQKMKYYYNYVQSHYCRHPIPDYYSIQLEVVPNRTSTAQVIRCDSQDELVPKCPIQYKDGDRYLKWNINSPCPSYMTTKLNPLKDGPNSVVCTDETDLLRQVFQRVRPTTQEYMFPSRECEHHRRQCEQCLKSATCPVSSASTNDSYMDDRQCCGIHCYSQTSCSRTFSKNCPIPTVECATGEVNIFSLFPHFDFMDRQFACHIKYVPPHQLYSVSYVIKIPTINFNTTSQQFTVISNSRSEHERRLSQFDFITAFHDTRIKVEDELILIGDHSELKHHQESLMKPYKARQLKTPSDLRKEKPTEKIMNSKASYVQFEKPFLYSSFSWYKDGCYKNMSQIYPNQTIYKDDFTPVISRKGHMGVSPETTLLGPQGFTYRIYHRDRAPYVKFVVEKGKSVLQHLQGRAAKGKLVAGSLFGRVVWDNETETWTINFSASQDECPTVISIKIFTQFFTACVGHFDLLINCPLDFTVTFNFSSERNHLPDIFVLQINDSATSHIMVLSSLFQSIYDNIANSQQPGQLQIKRFSPASRNGLLKIWILIFVILILTVILLITNCVFFKYIILKSKNIAQIVSGNSEGKTHRKQEEKVNKLVKLFRNVNCKRYFVVLFVLSYILYSCVFTFSLGFSIVYLTQYSVWSNITNMDIHSDIFLAEFNKSLKDIKQFEEVETDQLLASFNERTEACLAHLERGNRRQILDYEETTKKQLESIFAETGKARFFTSEIQKHNFSIYLHHIRDFISECNKTVTSIVERFQANFYLFIRNTAHNDWLKVPREIFLYQDGENPEMKYLTSTQVKQFASWLEVDKADELFVAKENVLGRLSSVETPEASTLVTSLPSLQPRIDFASPELNTANPSHFYTVLDPLFPNLQNPPSSQTEAEKPTSKLLPKTEPVSSGLSKNQQQYFLDKDNFPYKPQELTEIEKEMKKPKSGYNIEKGANYATNVEDKNSDNTDELSVVDVNFVNDEMETSTSRQELAQPSVPQTSSSEEESKKTDSKNLYILIATFLIFDVVLWVHRLTWLRRQLKAVRHGYPEKIPDDDVCKQLLEIQTAHHLVPYDESSRYFHAGSGPIYGTGTESGIIFLKDLTMKKSRNESLHDIWNEKVKTGQDSADVQIQNRGWAKKYENVKRRLHHVFLSNLVWQGSVTFIAVILICMIVYCVELWFTPENLRALVGERSTMANIQRHVATSDRYLQILATRLTGRLQQIKELLDSEVQVHTDLYFKTLNIQTSMFTAILQRLCREAKGSNCDKLIADHSDGERIVGCNFLPLQAKTFQEMSSSHMEAMVAAEATPHMNILHHTLMVSTSVLIFLLCSRLVCQVTVSLLRHFLLLTGRLPRLRIHQSEKLQIDVPGAHGTTMQRSQSWVDSCESGVYLGETEDTNKEDNR